MRISLLLLIGCLATSSSALKFIKSKIKPFGIHKHLKHIQQPVTVPYFATYARPVTTYGAHVSTYSVSSPSIVNYAVPVPAHTGPSYTASVAVYSQPLSVAYDAHPIAHLTEPVFLEPFGGQYVEEHFSHYDDYKR